VSAEADKIKMLIAMAERLTQAIEGDIAALKAGKPQEMRTLDPEIQRLSLVYGREALSFDIARSANAPIELRKKLIDITGRFRDALKLQNRLLTRVKNAGEGLIKAVAGEGDRRRAQSSTYAPPQTGYRPAAQPMLYNGVV
jgi:hypothetical protein